MNKQNFNEEKNIYLHKDTGTKHLKMGRIVPLVKNQKLLISF